MVKTDASFKSIIDIFKLIVDPNKDVAESDRIEISSDFQRGDEETGIWGLKDKQLYISSLLLKFPTGIICIIKSHLAGRVGNRTLMFKVLDGGNRCRAIRDFMQNKFPLENGSYYQPKDDYAFIDSELRYEFNALHIPIQNIVLERGDPESTIANMFTRLNTSAKPLSSGELIKSHGWLKDKSVIEMAKLFVGDTWTTDYTSEVVTRMTERWNEVFGSKNKMLKEGKRCASMAMMCGYFISAHESEFDLFDKRYDKLVNYLDINLTPGDIKNICTKINKFLDLMDVVYSRELFGSITQGIPSKKHVSPVWKNICEGKMTDGLINNMKQFYMAAEEDESLKNEYNARLGGNGETGSIKIGNIISMINNWADEHYYA
jgi:hypothetical protein